MFLTFPSLFVKSSIVDVRMLNECAWVGVNGVKFAYCVSCSQRQRQGGLNTPGAALHTNYYLKPLLELETKFGYGSKV